VVTYNSGAAIEECLLALAPQDCEIIVVDNASKDDTVERVRSVAQRIPLQLITISRNIGFAGGVNQGAHAASSKVLLFLNPDAKTEAGAIDALLDCFVMTGADAVGGALINGDGQPQKGFSFRRLPTLASLSFEALLINQVWPSNPVNRSYRCLDADLSHEQSVEQPAGACLAVTSEAWNSIEGMDADFSPVWFEDVDFCTRLLKARKRIFYCPKARFRHSGAHSVRQLVFRDKQMFWYRNMVRYAKKHLGAESAIVLRLAIFLGMSVRMLASVLGGVPTGLTLREALGGYSRVAQWVIRPVEKSGQKRAF
jgi:GT2 family glycosyltransferase